MKAGVLGVVDGDFTALDSVTETVVEDDHELERCLEIDRVFSLPSGEMAFEGRAAAETLEERAETAIDDGEIQVHEQPETRTRYTEFVGVPDEFVVVDNSRGIFAFDLIATQTDTAIDRATVDLDSFFGTRGSARPWKAGFYGTNGNSVSGVFHGEDLRETHDLDSLLTDSSLNQVGLQYGYDGAEVKMTAARSGYVEVYRPTAFDSAAYLSYLDEEIVPHVS